MILEDQMGEINYETSLEEKRIDAEQRAEIRTRKRSHSTSFILFTLLHFIYDFYKTEFQRKDGMKYDFKHSPFGSLCK